MMTIAAEQRWFFESRRVSIVALEPTLSSSSQVYGVEEGRFFSSVRLRYYIFKFTSVIIPLLFFILPSSAVDSQK
jgi:hypothetical protein